MRDTWNDCETRSPVPIKDGPHAYAEKAEVMLWSYADGDGEVRVWDLMNQTDNYVDAVSGEWVEEAIDDGIPVPLYEMLEDPEALYWFQNGGMFDFVVIDKVRPEIGAMMPLKRRRDTMVQAYAHSLPGSLDKLGTILKLKDADKKTTARGRTLIRLFCIPHEPDAYGKIYRNKVSHPKEWQEFIEYAAQDIHTMRAAHKLMPTWNYKAGKQMDLWHADLVINSRGFQVDTVLAQAAMEAAADAKARMATRTSEMTLGLVESTTQRDRLKDYLAAYGVDLPDLRADTLERRMADPELPAEVKELMGIRLRASMNSSAKYGAVLRGVSSDGRMRGTAQFRGAGRTGRWAHRLFQPGNLPRPAYSWPFIEACIEATKAGCLDMVAENPMEACASMIRSVIVAKPGHKLVVADLSNIEGRVAAWLAGEDHLLQAFRDYDAGTGFDTYIKTYAATFNMQPGDVPPKGIERQIGKCEFLLFTFGSGVGGFVMAANAYGVKLGEMTEAVYDTIPSDVRAEAEDFLAWLLVKVRHDHEIVEVTSTTEGDTTTIAQRMVIADQAKYEAAVKKAMFGLDAKVFITIDSIKRMFRRAHPMIVSMWEQLNDTIRAAIDAPGITMECRKLKIRCDGSWLRIGLPSGRCLAYPNIHISKAGRIAYTGQNQYTRAWCEIETTGPKVFENCVQAIACDQFAETIPLIEAAGYPCVLGVHDEHVTEPPDTDEYTAEGLSALLCADLGWNAGLPLAAKGFETPRYHKGD